MRVNPGDALDCSLYVDIRIAEEEPEEADGAQDDKLAESAQGDKLAESEEPEDEIV